ncbi:MAG: cation-translocating P-type ATPase [Bacillota bacterium]
MNHDASLRAEIRGLTSEAAAAALRESGPNELAQAASPGLLKLLIGILRTPMFLLLVACGTLYLVLGDLRDTLMLLGFVMLVIFITLYQEYKTERALSALKQLASPRALVIRDGAYRRIPARELVPGDVAAVAEGDRIPADGALLTGSGLVLDESLLTGESAPVTRSPAAGAERVLSGTLVLQGEALMHVTGTGRSSAIGAIGEALVTLEHPVTRLETETNRVVRMLAASGLAVSAVVAAGYAVAGAGWLQGTLAGLTLAMSVLPEEFPVVLTVFLALGAWRLARHQVLTRRPNAIETLGAVNVLCVDKTGTLTLNRMRLAAVDDGRCRFDFHGDALPSEGLAEALRYAALASAVNPFDPMEQALHAAASRLPGAARGGVPLREYPLSHALLAVTRVWETDEGVVAACKGAPEAVLMLCRLDTGRTAELERAAAALAERGWRVLGVAAAHCSAGALPVSQLGFAFRFLGFVAFEDPVRPGVTEAVRECLEAGIRVLMVTGDHRRTASAIAAQAGLPDPESALGGDELDALGDEALRERLRHVSVCCRITSQQKLRLVQVLQGTGDVVAMTGDGVNDAPALKAADIGIAMGARGTDVAREAADIVLADDAFPSIVRGVRMGRRIHGNLTRAVTYIIAVHVPIVGLAVLPLLAGWPLLLMPIHVMLVEMVIDPACSVVLEAEPESADLMRRQPRPLTVRLFSAARVRWGLAQGLLALLAVIGACSLGVAAGNPPDVLRSMAVVALILANLALIDTNRTPHPAVQRNPAVWWVASAAGSALLGVIFVPWLRALFHLGVLGVWPFAAAAGAALLASSLLRLMRFRLGNP